MKSKEARQVLPRFRILFNVPQDYGFFAGGVSVLELEELVPEVPALVEAPLVEVVSVLEGVVLEGVVALELVPVAEPLMLPLAEPEALVVPEVVSDSEVLLRVALRLQPAKPSVSAARPATRVSFN